VDGDYFCIVNFVLWIVLRGRRRRVMAVEFADLCVSTDGEKLHIVSGVSGCVSIWDGQLVGVGVAGVWGNLGNLGYVLSHQQISQNPYLNRIRCPRFEASGVGIRRVREIGKIDL